MKVLRRVVLLVAVGLSGCATQGSSQKQLAPVDTDTAPGVDGVWCGDAGHLNHNKVYVNIKYANNGKPSASPDTCDVKQGSTVTFRGPEGESANFILDFPSGPPGDGELASVVGKGRHKVVLDATEPPGTYKYGITANGHHVDPDLKIKPGGG
ncbi:hypothetical protein [Lysobacter fragariae]